MGRAGITTTIVALVVGGAVGWFGRGMMGAGGPPPMMGGMQMPPPTVKVLVARETLLAAANEYVASVEPLQEVVLRPEVSGRIEGVHFAEGAWVKAGDRLFTIDKSAYQATAAAADAERIQAKRRYDRLKQADARSVSASDLESAESDWLRANAAFELASVDLEYTTIKAPLSGRIGAAMVKQGNYVTPGSAVLARIVQFDPIRVVFSQTDREYLSARRRELSGDAAALEARVILPDGSALPTIGKKDFYDNAINPMTGTIAVRYLFENPDGLLVPGGYVTAQLSNPVGTKGIKIPQRALLVDQDGTYVLTVDDAGTVGIMRVEPGGQVGMDVIIVSGLNPGDKIITDGVQKAMPGTTVQVVPTEG